MGSKPIPLNTNITLIKKTHQTYRNASFSNSFNTSFWLFNFATSIGVLPSMFCSVLNKPDKDKSKPKLSPKREHSSCLL
ncbi:hypothetical protein Hanom_Chr03g00214301 [Helianthus anomalus]